MRDRITKRCRTEYYAGDVEKNKGLTTPDFVHRVDDIVYAQDEPETQKLDLYLPREQYLTLAANVTSTVSSTDSSGNSSFDSYRFPVIVSVHGGAWVYGCKEGYQFYCMSLVEHGFAVVNFTYRLCPEHTCFDELEDTASVIRWVLAHADEYHLDPTRIFMIGDSAGANLTSIFGGLCTNPAYRAMFPDKIQIPEGFVPTALGLDCGIYDQVTECQRDPESIELMQEVFQCEDVSDKIKYLSSIDSITAAYPPCFIMTCPEDFLHDQMAPFAARLASFGVLHETHDVHGIGRGLWHDYHTHITEPEAQEINRVKCEFFKRF